MGEMSWIWWMIIPLMFIMFAGRSERGGSCSRRRRGEHRSRKSEEIARLKQELEESQTQINALKSRLEAVETIVTDEETELRREFYKLQNS
ncbi:MAG: hypothetical protein NXH88_18085 [Hyphomonas sp.]|nr:hypothetical protein [Hyphomonas sp.]